jgi:tetratricopeptide (TPR) repeat protein
VQWGRKAARLEASGICGAHDAASELGCGGDIDGRNFHQRRLGANDGRAGRAARALLRRPSSEVRLLACKLIIEKGTAVDSAAMANAYTSRGTAYSITGDPDHAIEDFDHAIEIDPNRTLVFSFRGAAYLDKKDYDHAIADYTRSVELDAKHTDAFYGRASAYRGKGDYPNAILDYGRVIALEPDYLEAFAYRGLAYVETKDFDSAIADFDVLIKMSPNTPQAFDLRASRLPRQRATRPTPSRTSRRRSSSTPTIPQLSPRLPRSAGCARTARMGEIVNLRRAKKAEGACQGRRPSGREPPFCTVRPRPCATSRKRDPKRLAAISKGAASSPISL